MGPGWESDPSTVSGGIVPLGTVGLALAPDVGAGSDAPSERQAPGDFDFCFVDEFHGVLLYFGFQTTFCVVGRLKKWEWGIL